MWFRFACGTRLNCCFLQRWAAWLAVWWYAHCLKSRCLLGKALEGRLFQADEMYCVTRARPSWRGSTESIVIRVVDKKGKHTLIKELWYGHWVVSYALDSRVHEHEETLGLIIAGRWLTLWYSIELLVYTLWVWVWKFVLDFVRIWWPSPSGVWTSRAGSIQHSSWHTLLLYAWTVGWKSEYEVQTSMQPIQIRIEHGWGWWIRHWLSVLIYGCLYLVWDWLVVGEGVLNALLCQISNSNFIFRCVRMVVALAQMLFNVAHLSNWWMEYRLLLCMCMCIVLTTMQLRTTRSKVLFLCCALACASFCLSSFACQPSEVPRQLDDHLHILMVGRFLW